MKHYCCSNKTNKLTVAPMHGHIHRIYANLLNIYKVHSGHLGISIISVSLLK